MVLVHELEDINRNNLISNLIEIKEDKKNENASGKVKAFHDVHNFVRNYLYADLKSNKAVSKKAQRAFEKKLFYLGIVLNKTDAWQKLISTYTIKADE